MIADMSKAYQQNPVRITIDHTDEDAPLIHQIIYQTHDRFKAVFWILREYKPESAIIFCNLKATVKELTEAMIDVGLSAACLHGDLEQNDRDRVMAKFRNKSTRILIATDVAARGIDVQDLDLVVNYDFPKEPEVYVHRIGRTARAGKTGLAITLSSYQEKIPIRDAERKETGSMERFEIRELYHEPNRQAEMATLYIGGGRKDKVRPGDILGALTGDAAGLSATQVGKIEIHDRFSYVAVSRSIFHEALERLKNGRIKGRKFRVETVR
jgi:ATP-independent RNA helicase DbpA